MNEDGSSMNMNPELAKQLFADGAVLIIAGVPKGTEFGIDLCSYTVGENFRGVKMIPPGVHFVWCASQGLYGDSAPRVGFIHYFNAQEILVREWDNSVEELRERNIPTAELEKTRIRENLKHLDNYLAAYDYRYVCNWKCLVDSITQTKMENCRPANGTIRTNVELQSCPDSERPRGIPGETLQEHFKSNNVIDESLLLPNLKPIEGSLPRFTVLPDRIPKLAEPIDITRHSMDCQDAVDTLMNSFSDVSELLAEIQLAFVFYLAGFSLESLAQWRKVLNLISHSEVSVEKYKLFFVKYSEIIAHQLPYLPEELMDPTERNTVYKDVRRLLVNLNVNGLNVCGDRLSQNLKKSLNWDFVGLLEEDPEDMPVFVELT